MTHHDISNMLKYVSDKYNSRWEDAFRADKAAYAIDPTQERMNRDGVMRRIKHELQPYLFLGLWEDDWRLRGYLIFVRAIYCYASWYLIRVIHLVGPYEVSV
jgi:hypothetical protein